MTTRVVWFAPILLAALSLFTLSNPVLAKPPLAAPPPPVAAPEPELGSETRPIIVGTISSTRSS
jgi:hypothetical protein